MRVFGFLLATAILIGCCPCLMAADPVEAKGVKAKGGEAKGVVSKAASRELAARDVASPNMAMLVEVERPVQLIDNPLGRDAWALIRQTSGLQRALASPAVERFRHVAKFIEKSLSVDWHTGLARLTAGGILVVLQPTSSPAEPAVTVVVTAADEETLKRFIDAVQVEIHRNANAGSATGGNNTAVENALDKTSPRKAPDIETTRYRSFAIHRVGNGYFSRVGRQLVASNGQDRLEAALDRLADPVTAPSFELPASLRLVDAKGNAPAILATANLKLAREDPKTRSGLLLPANDPNPPFLLGGYVDLVRRTDFVAAGLFVDGPAPEVMFRFPVGSEGAFAGLRGFFATGASESAPPLLSPPGTLFSAGWYRDYQKLWDARSELVNSELVRVLDAANERARTEGLGVSIADFAQWIGPHFRVVAARQRDSVYKRKLDERLPSCALVVDLRNEKAVRERLLAPADGLLLAALGKMIGAHEKIDYRNATLTTFRFAEASDDTEPGKVIRYNFNPAYAIARGQLILGSTAEIVRDVIDDLERQSQLESSPEPGSERTTDRQYFSLAELSEFLKGYQARLERGAVQHHGLSSADAAREIDVIHKLLNRLGTLTTSSLAATDHFDIRIRLGGER